MEQNDTFQGLQLEVMTRIYEYAYLDYWSQPDGSFGYFRPLPEINTERIDKPLLLILQDIGQQGWQMVDINRSALGNDGVKFEVWFQRESFKAVK